MAPDTRNTLWTLLVILAVTIAILVIVASLKDAGAFS